MLDNRINTEAKEKPSGKKALKVGLCVLGTVAVGAAIYSGAKSQRIQFPPTKRPRFIDTSQAVGSATKIVNNHRPSGEAVLKLTGVKKTARDLGRGMGMSAQEVNKCIVEQGYAIRKPWGLELTELGKTVGEATLKTNKYDHTFRNIEWDEGIVDVLARDTK